MLKIKNVYETLRFVAAIANAIIKNICNNRASNSAKSDYLVFNPILIDVRVAYCSNDVLLASPGHYSVGFKSNYARRISFAHARVALVGILGRPRN